MAGAAVVIVAASLYWMYAPLAPLWWDRHAPYYHYYQGWISAERDVWKHHWAYSFHRFRVEGVQEWALVTQNIGKPIVPASVSDRERYLWGYNDRMEREIRGSLGMDFPDAYVRDYLNKGWIDRSSERPQRCSVHKRQMRLAIIPREVVWPFTMPRPRFPQEIAAETEFPYPDTTYKEDASLILTPAYVKIWVCEECGRAETEWLAAHSLPNQVPRPTVPGFTK
jgi:hypothetical protein